MYFFFMIWFSMYSVHALLVCFTVYFIHVACTEYVCESHLLINLLFLFISRDSWSFIIIIWCLFNLIPTLNIAVGKFIFIWISGILNTELFFTLCYFLGGVGVAIYTRKLFCPVLKLPTCYMTMWANMYDYDCSCYSWFIMEWWCRNWSCFEFIYHIKVNVWMEMSNGHLKMYFIYLYKTV